MVITGVLLFCFIVFFFFRLVSRTQGCDFEIKLEGNMVRFIPKGLTTGCKQRTKQEIELENSPCCGFILPLLSGSLLPRFPASFKSYGQDGKKSSFPNELFL